MLQLRRTSVLIGWIAVVGRRLIGKHGFLAGVWAESVVSG